MNLKKPTNTLTWSKDDKYVKIEKILNETTYINKATGEQHTLTELTEIPPIQRRRKQK